MSWCQFDTLWWHQVNEGVMIFFKRCVLMDRTDHRLVCELGDIRVDGWVPLRLTVDALTDASGADRLSACCGGAPVEVIEDYGRAHEGAVEHVGKVPVNAEAGQRRQNELLRLRGRLKEAVGNEDYEAAAALRDRIKELEGS